VVPYLEFLAEAMARAERKPGVFVSGSAIGYCGIDTGDRTLTEESPAGDDFLALSQRSAASAAASATAVVLEPPRPSVVISRS
jgi:NAD dependent epimerase/dehydratase family enzyme